MVKRRVVGHFIFASVAPASFKSGRSHTSHRSRGSDNLCKSDFL